MSNVIDLSAKRFEKVNALKIKEVCDLLDTEVRRLVFDDKIPPNELLPALCHRIGVYLNCTDANIPDTVKRLSRIMYREAIKGK